MKSTNLLLAVLTESLISYFGFPIFFTWPAGRSRYTRGSLWKIGRRERGAREDKEERDANGAIDETEDLEEGEGREHE